MSRGLSFVSYPSFTGAVGSLILAAALGAQAPVTRPVEPLDIPRAVKQAHTKGTRSPDGRPGAKYWQNRARYTMTITTAPPDRTLRGTEEITYVNSSPDPQHPQARRAKE